MGACDVCGQLREALRLKSEEADNLRAATAELMRARDDLLTEVERLRGEDVAEYVVQVTRLQSERDAERALVRRLRRMVFMLCGDLLAHTAATRFLPEIQDVYEEYKREQESGT